MNNNATFIAEQSTLGGLLLDDSKWLEVKQIVSADDFANEQNRKVFKSISRQLDDGKPADVVTLCDEKGLDIGYVAMLAKDTPSAANIVAYAKEVKKHASKRQFIALAKRTASEVEQGIKSTDEAFNAITNANLAFAKDKVQPFKLIPASELTAQPARINCLISGYVPEKSIIEVFGTPGSGKSFTVLDWSFCIATGIDWHGKRTRQGTVVYIAGEGFAGYGQRLRALEIKHGIPTNNLIISKQPASLTDKENALWVADAIHQYDPVMIVIDTLSRNFGAGDENSTRDMNAFISHLDLYIKGDAAVVLVHHSGHSEKNRARGSSVLNGAVDVEYCINKNENILTLSNTKAKEFEPPKSISFEMTPQTLDWLDEEGELIKSIVLNKTEWEPSNDKSKPRLTGRNEAILAALQRANEQHGIKPDKEITERFGGFSIGSGRTVCHVDYWRKEAYLVIDVEADEREMKNKRAAFNRAKDALRKNHVQTMDGYWWLICN